MSRTSNLAVPAVALTLLAVVVYGEPVWVSFDSTTEAVSPSVVIAEADQNHVIYDVHVHGMLVSDTLIDGEVYRRLSFPNEGVLGDVGLPELPFVTRLVGHAPNVQVTVQAQCEGNFVLSDYTSSSLRSRSSPGPIHRRRHRLLPSTRRSTSPTTPTRSLLSSWTRSESGATWGQTS